MIRLLVLIMALGFAGEALGQGWTPVRNGFGRMADNVRYRQNKRRYYRAQRQAYRNARAYGSYGTVSYGSFGTTGYGSFGTTGYSIVSYGSFGAPSYGSAGRTSYEAPESPEPVETPVSVEEYLK